MTTKPRDLVILSVQPQSLTFIWQLEVQLKNFQQYGLLDKYHVIFFVEKNDKILQEIIDLNTKYPEAKFFFYVDSKDECLKFIIGFQYVPILRPWCLKQHFKAHAELENAAVLYLDSDVVFTSKPEFLFNQEILDDNINYLSNTQSYNSASYFDSKIKDVAENSLEAYKKTDILDTCAKLVGINREICEINQNNTGGAQYLLKNINSRFWADVLDGCVYIITYLRNINQRYFKGSPGIERENNGFQSWCADMWSVLWNLWKRDMITRTPNFMDFAWSSSPIEDIQNKYMYHDADNCDQCFNKREYNTKSPIGEDLTWVDKTRASWFYAQCIMNI